MADTKSHKITYDDGTTAYLALDDDDVKTWRKLAESKTSNVKSVAPGEPKPFNVEQGS
ncbi:hypothetical protein [Miltoncostaea oceani]|uniref:hypothetical protein n=1 Tax=Miltoncostaea oceani TaxID=2843216 RepID=UPI001C3E0F63|nr:hypothetical protein [Miltoncostaea oceani]